MASVAASGSAPSSVPTLPTASLMASAKPDELPTAPDQAWRGRHGQYVYWIVFSHPAKETVQRLGLRTPAEFDRDAFSKLVVRVHKDCGVRIVETANFR